MSGMLLPDWFFFSFTKKISQLNAKEKVNLNSPMSKTMYKNFINNKCVEWRNIFECKKIYIGKANAVWKGLSETEKNSFIASNLKKGLLNLWLSLK